jgi:predicted helicase
MAAEKIPKSHPFLRQLFNHIAGPDVDDRVRWVVDELADLLQVTNIKLIMEDFGKATRTEDAVIHFYEDFLTAYNPDLRKSRGVFYTPQPAVGYVVSAIDEILQQDFKLRDGIADNVKIDVDDKKFHRVQILDPATGTGTFLAEMVRHIHAKIVEKNMQGAWNNNVANDLLPRLHGFEILMAPYAMAHLKLDMILEDTGYRFERDQRVGVYLTIALDGGVRLGAGSD